MTSDRAGAAFWTDAGREWARDGDRVELIGGPPGRAAMDRLQLRPGLRVLDVGCGTGATTIELARRTSPGGVTIGVDVAPTMLAAARRRRAAAGVEFRQGDVQQNELEPGSFDRVFSRFGVMFFDDPGRGFASLHRVLTAAGRLAFTAWAGPEHNEWMTVPATAASEALGEPVNIPAAGEPGPFSLANRDRITAVLEGAGFRDVGVTTDDDPVAITPAEALAFADGAMSHGGIRAALRGAGSDVERRIRRAIADALLARQDSNSAIRLRRGAHIVAAAA